MIDYKLDASLPAECGEREREVPHCCCIDRTRGIYMVPSVRTWKKQIL